MIKRPELLALEFYKSRPFKGSDKGIRYMIQKDTVEIESENSETESDSENAGESSEKKETKTVLTAFIWPEPFCFEVTPDEKKGSKQFDFSEEGLCEAIDWLNENHDAYAYNKK